MEATASEKETNPAMPPTKMATEANRLICEPETPEGAREGARVAVRPLDAAERRDEIARMLAGAEITAAARAAATSLLDAGSVR